MKMNDFKKAKELVREIEEIDGVVLLYNSQRNVNIQIDEYSYHLSDEMVYKKIQQILIDRKIELEKELEMI